MRKSYGAPAQKMPATCLLLLLFVLCLFFSEASASVGSHFPSNIPNGKIKSDISKYLSSFMTGAKIPGAGKKASEYAHHLVEEGKKRNVNPYVAASVLLIESGGRETVVSRGCVGLMQVKWSVHRKWIPRTFPGVRSMNDLKRASNNIAAGVAILGDAARRTKSLREALYRYCGKKNDRYTGKVLKHVSLMTGER